MIDPREPEAIRKKVDEIICYCIETGCLYCQFCSDTQTLKCDINQPRTWRAKEC